MTDPSWEVSRTAPRELHDLIDLLGRLDVEHPRSAAADLTPFVPFIDWLVERAHHREDIWEKEKRMAVAARGDAAAEAARAYGEAREYESKVDECGRRLRSLETQAHILRQKLDSEAQKAPWTEAMHWVIPVVGFVRLASGQTVREVNEALQPIVNEIRRTARGMEDAHTAGARARQQHAAAIERQGSAERRARELAHRATLCRRAAEHCHRVIVAINNLDFPSGLADELRRLLAEDPSVLFAEELVPTLQ